MPVRSSRHALRGDFAVFLARAPALRDFSLGVQFQSDHHFSARRQCFFGERLGQRSARRGPAEVRTGGRPGLLDRRRLSLRRRASLQHANRQLRRLPDGRRLCEQSLQHDDVHVRHLHFQLGLPFGHPDLRFRRSEVRPMRDGRAVSDRTSLLLRPSRLHAALPDRDGLCWLGTPDLRRRLGRLRPVRAGVRLRERTAIAPLRSRERQLRRVPDRRRLPNGNWALRSGRTLLLRLIDAPLQNDPCAKLDSSEWIVTAIAGKIGPCSFGRRFHD